MMKKVLYGVALALFASVSVGSLQSCKDDLNDFQTSTSYDLTKLRSDVGAEISALDARVKTNEGNIAEIKADYAKLSFVNQKLGELEQAYKDADTALQTKLENQINGAISTLENSLLDKINTGNQDLKAELEGKIGANTAAIEALDKYVKETLQGNIDNEFEQVYLQLEEAREMLSQVLNTLQEQIDGVNEKLDAVDGIIKSVVNLLDKRVSGILIQGVKSPVFGDFRLPIGVKSNILFNWYGFNENDKEIAFPSNDANFNVNGDPRIDLAALKPAGAIKVPSGYYGDVLLGKVYVTVNPVGTTFDNLELSIEPSAGDPLPMKVVLEPSDEVLYHGYTSRSEENGFYEGEVVLPAENIEDLRITISDGLKSSMKAALKDPSKRTAVGLLKAVYDQMAGMLPAYALRYDWTTGAVPSLDEEDVDPGFSQKANAVLSQYDLAVATAHPLSYGFLADKSFSHKLPILSPMENLIQKLIDEGTFKIKIDDIKIDQDSSIEIGTIDISTDVTINPSNLVITIKPITVVGITDAQGNPVKTELTTITLTGNNELKDVYAAIETGMENALKDIKSKIDIWSDDLDKNVNGQLNSILKDVETQINGMIGSINGQIDSMVENIADKFQGVFDKVNKAFNIYNKIAKKVNNFLSDPNAYLQVTALYSMNDGFGFVSGDANRPTTFTNAGGNAFKLYLTSYTGELIVPAYKKYVAVTGVKGDDTRTLAEINAAAGESFNVVLDGSEIEVLAAAAAFKKGNVYEFTYQAIDYSVHTSTRKFYIQVK